MQILVAYDVHIGQRNWQELTAFGEARMNGHAKVASMATLSYRPMLAGSSRHLSHTDSLWLTTSPGYLPYEPFEYPFNGTLNSSSSMLMMDC